MNIKNNIKIEKLDDQARGICYIDNKITFVSNALPGEIVNVDIIKENKKYNIAKVVEYEKKSDDRIEVKCPYYNECGGCNLLHVNYDYSIKYKQDKIKNILNKFAQIDCDIKFIKNNNVFNYRNKIDLKIENYCWGYYNSNTHNFIEIEKCMLVNDEINKIISNKDLFSICNGSIIIRCNYNNELIIVISSKDNININIDKLKKIVKLVGVIINNEVYYGEKYFIECVNNKFFKVNYSSFFQVNPFISTKLVEIIKNNIFGRSILDLYCGVGFLGQSVSDNIDKIYGIELNQNSILDAISNANMNKLNNTYYMCRDSSKIIDKIQDDIDTLIIDPPRTGLYKNMYEDIKKINANRLIYVSCNPVTLARDLKVLKDYYFLEKVYALDMFSNTYHVECVSVLSRKNK